jgi:hypothetical protein
METVEISTDVLPEAMLEKLGLPCPKYDKKHAGGGCFEDSDLPFLPTFVLTYYEFWLKASFCI